MISLALEELNKKLFPLIEEELDWFIAYLKEKDPYKKEAFRQMQLSKKVEVRDFAIYYQKQLRKLTKNV